MNSKEPVSICVLGCGTMGIAIISGSLESKTNLGHITACVSSEDSGKRLRNLYGDQVNVVVGDNASGIGASNVVLLCTKPQMAKLVLQDEKVYEQLKDKILISICAGITLSQLQDWTPDSTVVIRAMPNTPCKIREGMTVLGCLPNTSHEHRDLALGLFSPLGRCRFMDEKHFDAVTSLSGSGPAFACVVLEALADGGVMMGLPRDVALELAAQGSC
ncbi:delta 1-pyrroline-5-carboxylate reductase [Basidiobolus ranarum]|uniref:Delta 1-pyrroline-5-carboxylate reductase n=1 Tax=Basidiobolus ranarum TaxID=34480 RepID=A0ABR2W3N5_9FUNG